MSKGRDGEMINGGWSRKLQLWYGRSISIAPYFLGAKITLTSVLSTAVMIAPIVAAGTFTTGCARDEAMGALSNELSTNSGSSSSLAFHLPRGVWVSNVNTDVFDSRETMNEALNHIESLGADAVYPVVWNKQSFFFSGETMYRELGPQYIVTTRDGDDVLETFSSLAKNRGLGVYASFESGLKIALRTDGKPELIPLGKWISGRENWLVLNSDHQPLEMCTFDVCFGYLNITNPEVADFLLGMMTETLEQYDVDGIIIDDHFSIPTWPPSCDPQLVSYEMNTTGSSLMSNVATMLFNYTDIQLKTCEGETARERRGAIYFFMKKLRAVAQNLGKKVILSPAGVPSWSKREWSQDWGRMVREGAVDGVIMQAFRGLTFRSMVYSRELAKLRRDVPHVPLGVVVLLGLKEHHYYAHGERIFRQTRTSS